MLYIKMHTLCEASGHLAYKEECILSATLHDYAGASPNQEVNAVTAHTHRHTHTHTHIHTHTHTYIYIYIYT